MYEVAVTRSFVAQHFLTVPDPGPEGRLHSHQFTVESRFAGPELDEYGYLVDIDDLSEAVEATTESLRDVTLNELPAFEGTNPSAERLAGVFADRLLDRIRPPAANRLTVCIREDDVATVAHERPL